MADAVNARVTDLQCDVTDADEKLKQLYRLIADGIGIVPKPRSNVPIALSTSHPDRPGIA